MLLSFEIITIMDNTRIIVVDSKITTNTNVTENFIKDLFQKILFNVQLVVVGADDVVEILVNAILNQGHVLLEDVPGTGKTTIARSVAKSIGASFGRIQFTPDLMPSDVVGINYYSQKTGEFEYRPGPLFHNILLADEINRATPRTQSALLEAMEEKTITIDGVSKLLPEPFIVLATQNPVELEGTFPLPEAQLDRFFLRTSIGYPTASDEMEIIKRFEQESPLVKLQSVVTSHELMALRKHLPLIHLDESLGQYAVDICRATRVHEAFDLGASPRASLALVRAARCRAAIKGRLYVQPDDIQAMLKPVLTHRLILNSNSRVRGQLVDDLMNEIAESIPVPIIDQD